MNCRVVLFIWSWLLSSLIQALGLAPQLSNSGVKGPVWRRKSIHHKGYTPKNFRRFYSVNHTSFGKQLWDAVACQYCTTNLVPERLSHSKFGIIHKHWNKYILGLDDTSFHILTHVNYISLSHWCMSTSTIYWCLLSVCQLISTAQINSSIERNQNFGT